MERADLEITASNKIRHLKCNLEWCHQPSQSGISTDQEGETARSLWKVVLLSQTAVGKGQVGWSCQACVCVGQNGQEVTAEKEDQEQLALCSMEVYGQQHAQAQLKQATVRRWQIFQAYQEICQIQSINETDEGIWKAALVD